MLPRASTIGVSRLRLWQRAGAAAGAACLCICCGGARVDASGPSVPRPAYTGRAADLFNDAIDPAALGFAGDDGTPANDDAMLRERTQTADAVVRARVVTITSSEEDGQSIWQVGLRPVQTLAGKSPPAGDFTFRVGPQTPAARLVRSLEGQLVGTAFVVFMREFASAADDAGLFHPDATHFHFEKDDKAELENIHRATLLGELP